MDRKGKILSSITWQSRFRKQMGIDVHPSDIHDIFKQFGVTPYVMKQWSNGKQVEGYYESDVNTLLSRGEGLTNALKAKGVPYVKNTSKTEKKKPYVQYVKSKVPSWKPMNFAEPEDLPKRKSEYISRVEVEPTYRNDENDMEKHSDYLIQQYQFEGNKPKKVILTTEQFERLFENNEKEGFQIKRDRTFEFNPHHNRMADTDIFDENGELKVRKMLLPKSQVVSYNLYNITNMNVNKALKTQKDINGMPLGLGKSIEPFLKRTCLYMKRIIGNNTVDYITYPQSSSPFNAQVVEMLRLYYPNSEGIKIIPEMLTKNVRGIYVNTQLAKELGFTNEEIYHLQKRVDKWKKDEDIRDTRRKLQALKDEIAYIIANRGKGRPSKEFMLKQQQVKNYEDEIALQRAHMRGRDGTYNKNTGEVKDWQIKTIDDRDRKVIEGMFEINPQYLELKSKLQGKSIILFDDNISSGATLDDLCCVLKMYGVANIIPLTLGFISPTIYKDSDRRGAQW